MDPVGQVECPLAGVDCGQINLCVDIRGFELVNRPFRAANATFMQELEQEYSTELDNALQNGWLDETAPKPTDNRLIQTE